MKNERNQTNKHRLCGLVIPDPWDRVLSSRKSTATLFVKEDKHEWTAIMDNHRHTIPVRAVIRAVTPPNES